MAVLENHSVEKADAIQNRAPDVEIAGVVEDVWRSRWGVWSHQRSRSDDIKDTDSRYLVRLSIAGREIRGCFETREEALSFQTEQLASQLHWPRQQATTLPERSPLWDHPEELEAEKEYVFRELRPGARKVLSDAQVQEFNQNGFLLGLPVLDPDELQQVQVEFEELLRSRVERASSDEARFRAAHTMSRPLHQDLVAQLAKHERVLAIVEDVLGPHFVAWSAHLFCKLPGDPTEQPWHQDAGFWPLSESRALTLWIAFDDVDSSNSAVTFIEGSHRVGRIPWQSTGTEHHLLTQEIPDVDLLGRAVTTKLRAGEASLHCDLTVHGSLGNQSTRRRAGLALRFVGADASCLGPMINGYQMNTGCILPKGPSSDPRGHWKALRRRPGKRAPNRSQMLAASAPPAARERDAADGLGGGAADAAEKGADGTERREGEGSAP
eukprot:TRINITY_DN4067_c0_g2_i1.p1 TRINITY_DN4067_c0_g2~~TRINITY_DN4067_c0_g2_i1.p1  ORF type:complete len:449 (+),score=60.73 TRINITY_DN4067_c0_g2_i1:35-1348(+)